MAFGNSNEIKKLPNEADILNNAHDYEIFAYYLGGLPKKPINSPLRDDVKPSFSVFFSKMHRKYLYKDFATGEVGDAFVLVMRLFKLRNRTDAFNKIASDFHMNQFELDSSVSTTPRRRLGSGIKNPESLKEKTTDIKVRIRPWSKNDRNYWGDKYGFSTTKLEFCGVYPISHYFINGLCVKAEKQAYAYVEHKDGVQTFKIYQPFSKDRKWVNNNNYSTWELWTQLPKTGKKLIIASSRKDAMIIKNLFLSRNVTACALQSENVNPKESVINELKLRFKEIYVLYDNDFNSDVNRGRIAGEKLSQKFGLKQIELPELYKCKDPSDLYEALRKERTKNIISKLLQK